MFITDPEKCRWTTLCSQVIRDIREFESNKKRDIENVFLDNKGRSFRKGLLNLYHYKPVNAQEMF